MQIDASTQTEKRKTQSDNAKLKADLKSRACRFGLAAIRLVDQLAPGDSGRELGRQLLRSATSIGANIIEARASGSKREFAQYFGHALRSANETKFWLCLLRDANKAPRPTVDTLLEEANELANMIAASLLTLRGRR